jgi:hypothetical protein
MAQWYETLHVAIGHALRGDETALQTVRSELEAHPVLGPFAVQELICRLASQNINSSIVSRSTSLPCWSNGDVARVLEILCVAAAQSRKTQQVLLASLCEEGRERRGALIDAMVLVDWRIKMCTAAHFVSRLHVPSSFEDERSGVVRGNIQEEAGGGGCSNGGLSNALGMIAEMVESAVSLAQVALLKDDGAQQGTYCEHVDIEDTRVSDAAVVLLAKAEHLKLSITARAVMQGLCSPPENGAKSKDTALAVEHPMHCFSRNFSRTFSFPRSSWDLCSPASLSSSTIKEDEAVIKQYLVRQHHQDVFVWASDVDGHYATKCTQSPSSCQSPSHRCHIVLFHTHMPLRLCLSHICALLPAPFKRFQPSNRFSNLIACKLWLILKRFRRRSPYRIPHR